MCHDWASIATNHLLLAAPLPWRACEWLLVLLQMLVIILDKSPVLPVYNVWSPGIKASIFRRRNWEALSLA